MNRGNLREKFCFLALSGLLVLPLIAGDSRGDFFVITGGQQEVIGDPGGTNFANPNGSTAGKGLPTQLGGWPNGPGFAPDPSFPAPNGGALGISGYHSVGANLSLTQSAFVTFTYFGSGDSTQFDRFYVDVNRNSVLEDSEILFTGRTSGQGESRTIFLDAGLVPFAYVAAIPGNPVTIFNGANLNHDNSPAFFLGVDPYEATSRFQTSGNTIWAGLTDLPGTGDHDFQDLGVRISAVPEPISLVMAGSAFGCIAFYRWRRRNAAE